MEERSNHLTVVVGASDLAEEVRRVLVRRREPHFGITTHLRGLRSSLVRCERDLVIVCVALDAKTIARHHGSMQKLLADCGSFSSVVRCIGLLTDRGMSRDAVSIGCDVYASDRTEAIAAIRHFISQSRGTLKAARFTSANRLSLPQQPNRVWLVGTRKINRTAASICSSSLETASDRLKAYSSRPTGLNDLIVVPTRRIPRSPRRKTGWG